MHRPARANVDVVVGFVFHHAWVSVLSVLHNSVLQVITVSANPEEMNPNLW